MIIFANNAIRLQIELEGYTYPFAKDDWDANWLQVKIKLHDYGTNEIYESSDACLLTMELVDLKEWFTRIEKNRTVSSQIKFMEPNIGFEYKQGMISILLKYDFNPQIDYDKTERDKLGSPYIINFKLDEINLSKAIKTLQDLILKFPKRKDPK